MKVHFIMLVHNLFFIIGIYFVTVLQNVLSHRQDKQINAHLSVVLTFDNQNSNNNKATLKNVRKSNKNNNNFNHKTRHDHLKKRNIKNFHDFLQKAIKILNKYNDNDLKHCFELFNGEMNKYYVKNYESKEDADNVYFRRFINNHSEKIGDKPIDIIRQSLTAVAETLKEENKNKTNDLTIFFNSLIAENAIDKFKKFLMDMDSFRLKTRHDIDLGKVFKDIKHIVFDHYTNLNHSLRDSIQSKMNVYWNMGLKLSNDMLRKIYRTTERSIISSKYTSEEIDITTAKRKQKAYRSKHINSHKKAPTTTETYRPFRQMYVEKNIDLKYDATAYDRFTTTKHKVTKNKKSHSKTPKFRTRDSQLKEDASEIKNIWHKKSDVLNSEDETVTAAVETEDLFRNVVMRSYIPTKIQTSDKVKYDFRLDNTDLYLTGPELNLKKPEFELKISGLHLKQPKVENEIPVWQILNMQKSQYGQANNEPYLKQHKEESFKHPVHKSRKSYKNFKTSERVSSGDRFHEKRSHRKANTNVTVDSIPNINNIATDIPFKLNQEKNIETQVNNPNITINEINNKTIINNGTKLQESDLTLGRTKKVKKLNSVIINELKKIQELKYYSNVTIKSDESEYVKERAFDINEDASKFLNTTNQVSHNDKFNKRKDASNTDDQKNVLKEKPLMRSVDFISTNKTEAYINENLDKGIELLRNFNTNNTNTTNLNQSSVITLYTIENNNRIDLQKADNNTLKAKNGLEKLDTGVKDVNLNIDIENGKFLANDNNLTLDKTSTVLVEIDNKFENTTIAVVPTIVLPVVTDGRRRYSKYRKRRL